MRRTLILWMLVLLVVAGSVSGVIPGPDSAPHLTQGGSTTNAGGSNEPVFLNSVIQEGQSAQAFDHLPLIRNSQRIDNKVTFITKLQDGTIIERDRDTVLKVFTPAQLDLINPQDSIVSQAQRLPKLDDSELSYAQALAERSGLSTNQRLILDNVKIGDSATNLDANFLGIRTDSNGEPIGLVHHVDDVLIVTDNNVVTQIIPHYAQTQGNPVVVVAQSSTGSGFNPKIAVPEKVDDSDISLVDIINQRSEEDKEASNTNGENSLEPKDKISLTQVLGALNNKVEQKVASQTQEGLSIVQNNDGTAIDLGNNQFLVTRNGKTEFISATKKGENIEIEAQQTSPDFHNIVSQVKVNKDKVATYNGNIITSINPQSQQITYSVKQGSGSVRVDNGHSINKLDIYDDGSNSQITTTTTTSLGTGAQIVQVNTGTDYTTHFRKGDKTIQISQSESVREFDAAGSRLADRVDALSSVGITQFTLDGENGAVELQASTPDREYGLFAPTREGLTVQSAVSQGTPYDYIPTDSGDRLFVQTDDGLVDVFIPRTEGSDQPTDSSRLGAIVNHIKDNGAQNLDQVAGLNVNSLEGAFVSIEGQQLTKFTENGVQTVTYDGGTVTGITTTSSDGSISSAEFTQNFKAGKISGLGVKVDGQQYVVVEGSGLFSSTKVFDAQGNEVEGDQADAIKDLVDAPRALNQEAEHVEAQTQAFIARGGELDTVQGIYKGISVAADGAFAFRGYSSLFMSDEEIKEWRESVDQVFASLHLGTQYWASALCSNRLDQPAGQQVAYAFGPNPYEQFLPAGGVVVAATCTGEKQIINDPVEGRQFLYKITMYARNPSDNDMQVNVQLTGERSVNLFDQDVTVPAGGTFSRSGASSFVQFSNINYDQCCIQLKNGPVLVESSETTCNRIVIPNSAPTFVQGPPAVDGRQSSAPGATTGPEFNTI